MTNLSPTRSIIQRFTIVFLLIGSFVLEILVGKFIHGKFSEPRTDLMGGPLLYPHGGINLQIMAFVAFQFVFLPIMFLIYLASNLNQTRLFRRNFLVMRDKFWLGNSHKHEFLMLSILLLNLIVVTTYYFLYSVNLPFSILFPTFLTLAFVIGVLLISSSQRFASKAELYSQKKTPVALISITVTILTLELKYLKIDTNLTKVFFYLGLMWLITSAIGIKRIKLESKLRDFKNLYIYLPAFVFLFYSRISGDVRALSPFESFQVSNARLMYDGGLPWRNFTVPHGLWSDAMRNFIGGLLVDRTIWGQFQGISAVVHPLEVLTFGVVLYLLSRKLFITIGILGLLKIVEVLSNQDTSLTRMLPTMVIVLILRNYLVKSSYQRALLLGIVGGIQILWAFEGIYAVVGVIFLLVAKVLFKDSPSLAAKDLGLFSIGILLTIIIPLLSLGLLEPWYREFRLDSSGYIGAWGGLLFLWDLGFTYFMLVLLVPSVVILFLSGAIKNIYFKSGSLDNSYLWLLPLVTAAAAFYLKFLQWPDWHIMQSASLLLTAFFLYYATLKERKFQYGVTILSVTCLLWVSLATVPVNAKYVKAPLVNRIIGPADIGTNQYAERLMHVQSTFSKWLIPLSSKKIDIFDFGNEPLSWFGILNYTPSNGFDKVLNFASLESQEIVIDALKKNPPAGIVWGGEVGYWQGLYNGTWMMQYRITQFILENYDPVASDGGYVLFKKKDSRIPPDDRAIEQVKSVNCEWHQGVKNFNSPESASVGTYIPVRPTSGSIDVPEVQVEFVLPQAGNRKAIFVSSSIATEVTLTSSGGSGVIRFVLPGDSIKRQVWLGGCPLWNLREESDLWVAKYGGDQNNVKFYSSNL